jgi:hypothetical protein
MFLRVAMMCTVIISAPAMRRPGITPPMKSAPSEAPETSA